jgi:DNA-binding NtrC family response regulator
MADETKRTVLVVDDEPIVRESIKDWLTDAGYAVRMAESGEEALKIVDDSKFDFVVIDVRLPGKTGIKTLQELKSVCPEIKSVVITAYPSQDFADEAKKYGAVDYLVKPVNPDDLEKLIRQAIAGGQ